MANKKSIGLPGGPNEYITDISEYLSVEGYKFNSPDVDNPFNIIDSGSITMQDVEFPVLGTDNLGNSQMMFPENDYQFPGDMVFEMPIAQEGGSVSWKWKGKSYSGKLIPSMENEKNRYARTKNGKIKTLPKGQMGNLGSYPIKEEKEELINKLNSETFLNRYVANYKHVTGKDIDIEVAKKNVKNQIDFTNAGSDNAIVYPYTGSENEATTYSPYYGDGSGDSNQIKRDNAIASFETRPFQYGDDRKLASDIISKDAYNYPYSIGLQYDNSGNIRTNYGDPVKGLVRHELAHSYNRNNSPLFDDMIDDPTNRVTVDGKEKYRTNMGHYDAEGSLLKVYEDLFGKENFKDFNMHASMPLEISSAKAETEGRLLDTGIWDYNKEKFGSSQFEKMLNTNERLVPNHSEPQLHLQSMGFSNLKGMINDLKNFDKNDDKRKLRDVYDEGYNVSTFDEQDSFYNSWLQDNKRYSFEDGPYGDKSPYQNAKYLLKNSKTKRGRKYNKALEFVEGIENIQNIADQKSIIDYRKGLENDINDLRPEVERKMKIYFNELVQENNPNQPVMAQQGKEQLPEAQFGLLKNALKPTVKFLKKYLTKADDVVPGKTSEVNFIDNIYKQQLKDAPRIPNQELYNNPPRLEDLVSHYNKQSDGVTSVYRYGFDPDMPGGAWYSADLGDPLRYVKYKRGDAVFKADVPNDILRQAYRGKVNNADAYYGKIPGLDPDYFQNSETLFKEFRLSEGLASAFQDQKFGKKTIQEYIDYLKSLKQKGGTIRQYDSPGFFENIGDVLANPITAFGYTARGEDIPDRLNVNIPNRNNFDMVADIINPFAWYQYGENAYNDFSKGEYLDGTLNSLGALPVVPATIVAAKNLKTPLQKIAANTNKLLSNANTNIQSGISGVRPPASNRPFTQYWDGMNWVSSKKEQAINTLENLQNQYKTLKNSAYNKVKGAESKLKRVEGKMQGLLDDFERQGFDTKELKDDAFMNMFKEYNLFKRGAKDQKRVISDMTDEFYEMRDFYKGESGGYDDLLEQITKGEKLDADLIKKHLDKSLWERIKNLGETLPGGPGDGPGLRLQQGGSMPSRSQIIDEQNKKDNQVLGLTNIIDYMVESRGGNEKTWTDLADNIAFHESGPQQRMNPQARQITKDGKKDGLGRGMFQFEPESFETAKIRYKNVADAVGYKLDENILNAESALDLNAKDQYTLFFANLIESPAVLKDYVDGKLSMADVWLKGHKNVSKEGNRKSFANSMEAAKKELGKTGFLQFSLEDLLPYKKGGESDMLDTYKNYINGKVRSQEAVNVYDKLNRIHLNDARRMGMTVPNYIMTHL
jgi:hypothetical protein